MAKFYGEIGYVIPTEKSPGVWVDEIVKRHYYGDVNRNSRRLQSSSEVNDNITISNEISIVADPFAVTNFHWIKYVKFMGAKWKVTNIEVQHPRLILTVGGLYNVEQT